MYVTLILNWRFLEPNILTSCSIQFFISYVQNAKGGSFFGEVRLFKQYYHYFDDFINWTFYQHSKNTINGLLMYDWRSTRYFSSNVYIDNFVLMVQTGLNFIFKNVIINMSISLKFAICFHHALRFIYTASRLLFKITPVCMPFLVKN